MTSTADHSRSNVVPLSSAPADGPSVRRHGLGYRGVIGPWLLEMSAVRSSRGDVSGSLEVGDAERCLFRGRFNAASLTTRSSLARYLKERTAGYAGWPEVLERFCWHVLRLEAEGAPFERVGALPLANGSQHLLGSMLPKRSPTIWYGRGGSFKSTLAAAASVSLRTGQPVAPGWTVVEAGEVLVLDWESDRQAWNDRIAAIARAAGLAVPQILYRRCDQPLAEQVEAVAAVVAREGVGLLIVDSVALAQGSGREGGDAAESTLRLFAALRAIGTTSLLIAHVKGEDVPNERAGTRPYGSVFQLNLARSAYELRCEERPLPGMGTEILLLHRKVNEGPTQLPTGLRIRHGNGTISFEQCEVDAPDLEQHSGSTADRMRRLLRDGAMGESELAEMLSVSRVTIRQTLRRASHFQRLPDSRIGLVL